MTRLEQRIASIRLKIHKLDREIRFAGNFVTNTAIERLMERRDLWEERLVQAECGPLKVYSRTGEKEQP